MSLEKKREKARKYSYEYRERIKKDPLRKDIALLKHRERCRRYRLRKKAAAERPLEFDDDTLFNELPFFSITIFKSPSEFWPMI